MVGSIAFEPGDQYIFILTSNVLTPTTNACVVPHWRELLDSYTVVLARLYALLEEVGSSFGRAALHPDNLPGLFLHSGFSIVPYRVVVYRIPDDIGLASTLPELLVTQCLSEVEEERKGGHARVVCVMNNHH